MSISTAENNKGLIRSYLETWNRGDLQELATYWSPGMVHHTRYSAHGVDDVRMIVSAFMNAFEGTHFEIDDMIAEDDRVVTRMTWSGRHVGEYLGVKPTGTQVRCTLIGIARVRDGK